ncbi:MAG: hypothetical protein R6U62_10285 [Bacteroidales bacterium]
MNTKKLIPLFTAMLMILAACQPETRQEAEVTAKPEIALPCRRIPGTVPRGARIHPQRGLSAQRPGPATAGGNLATRRAQWRYGPRET